MRKKLLNSKGFTLAEVLIAVAILAIFVSMAAVGTTALFGTGEQMMGVSKAAVLGSDVMQVITNEVRFGEEFKFVTTNADGTQTETTEGKDKDTINYNSTTYGEGSILAVKDGQLVVTQPAKTVGAEDKTFRPIGTAAYDEVRILSMTFSISGEVVTCHLQITQDGTTVAWENSVSLVPLYHKALQKAA